MDRIEVILFAEDDRRATPVVLASTSFQQGTTVDEIHAAVAPSIETYLTSNPTGRVKVAFVTRQARLGRVIVQYVENLRPRGVADGA